MVVVGDERNEMRKKNEYEILRGSIWPGEYKAEKSFKNKVETWVKIYRERSRVERIYEIFHLLIKFD